MLNIKQKYFDELIGIFREYCPKAEIWAFGSRVKNDCHSGSDLDLTVKSFNDENKSVAELKSLLENSDIPFLIDVSDFETLPKSFRTEIEKNYVRIF